LKVVKIASRYSSLKALRRAFLDDFRPLLYASQATSVLQFRDGA
jgi:hypothetical protein